MDALGAATVVMANKALELGKDLDELPGMRVEMEADADAIKAAAKELE